MIIRYDSWQRARLIYLLNLDMSLGSGYILVDQNPVELAFDIIF